MQEDGGDTTWADDDAALLAGDAASSSDGESAALADAGSDAEGEALPSCLPNVGPFSRIYDPSAGELWAWYINDHTIVRGTDGLWHLFGITHPEPAMPRDEREFAHATSPELAAGSWTKLPSALTADQEAGETVLWAPHVIEQAGTFYMFYCGGGEPERFQIKLATSSDLMQWQRAPAPLFTDGYEGRDPFVLRVGSRWVMYYTATSEPRGGRHVVAYRTSEDLLSWSERGIAFTDASEGTGAGPTESPFVVARPEGFYLFIGPRHDYVSTEVFFSRDPFHFEGPALVEIEAHAPEIVADLDGSLHMSRAGWFQGGVDLAPMTWDCGSQDLLPSTR